MIALSEINEYTQKTAEVIASVLDMQVIVCDGNRKILGDSYADWNSKNNITSILSNNSILTVVVEQGKEIILDCKEKHKGCLRCINLDKCEINAIVGVPIKYNEKTIGAIGILADTEESKTNLLNKIEYFLGFTYQMSELLVSKLIEREKNIQLRIAHEELVTVINAMDIGIIDIDDKGSIVYMNSNVYEFIDEALIKNNLPIHKLIEKDYIKRLVYDHESFKNIEITFKDKNKQLSALISAKTITIDNNYVGAVITLKRMSDVYNEVNELSIGKNFMSFDDIIGESEEIISVKEKAALIANSSSTVLIQGESGTGKELFARAIHDSSNISGKPFIAINCAAIPDSLLESELFGYEEGAFTGARKAGQIGKFQLADNGTVYLDEIEEMPIHLQSKLLRVLQERKIEKLGGKESVPVNIRVIASTNKDLEEMIRTGEFREDLYYRLNVIPIYIPPLRDRKGDIAVLYSYFLNVLNKRLGKNIKGFTRDVEEVLLNHKWSGNVRELQNVVECAVNMARGEYITLSDIPIRISKEKMKCSEESIIILNKDEMMKKQISDALKRYGSNLAGKIATANALGISTATLYRKIKMYNLDSKL